MGENKQAAAVKEFKDALNLIKKKKNDHWAYYSFLGEDQILEHWNAVSYADKKRIVSSKTWNRYPAEAYNGKKIFGPVIWKLVDVIMHSSDKERKILVNNSEGVFALAAFSYANSKEKTKMSKRLLHSTDARLRTRAVDTLPIKDLKKAVYDSNMTIVYKAVKRIGISNCYKPFLPTPRQISAGSCIKYINVIALREASYNDVKHLIEAISEKTRDIDASILISKISKDDIPFYLDQEGRGMFSREIILKKLGVMPQR